MTATWPATISPTAKRNWSALLADVKPTIPPYTRVNRLFRDIPAHHIQAGVKLSNLRQVVHDELARRGQRCGCIRCREIRLRTVAADAVTLRVHRYATDLTRNFPGIRHQRTLRRTPA
jgi:elongator complex protein 3